MIGFERAGLENHARSAMYCAGMIKIGLANHVSLHIQIARMPFWAYSEMTKKVGDIFFPH